MEFLAGLFSNLWSIFMIVLFFGGSIFVHELGHFLAARRRGLKVDRFSIGFGPAIFSWRGKDGVDYRVSWLPLGGYVALPQLADLSLIEGESDRPAAPLPPISYATKMIVFVAGATCNLLFAFALACIVWFIGEPVSSSLTSTTIAEVLPTIKTSEGKEVVSPAVRAGLKSGDLILRVDGQAVATFNDIVEHLALSSGWNKQGERETVFTIRRDGTVMDVSILPVLSGDEKVRMVGFYPVAKLVVGRVAPQSAAQKAGLLPDDQIVAVNQTPMLTLGRLLEALRADPGQPLQISVLRGGQSQVLKLERAREAKDGAEIGLALKSSIIYAHPPPWVQVGDAVFKTFRTFAALINPRSDIGLSHLSGPVGIISNFMDVSHAGLRFVLWFTILVNVNLAVFNLLPIPVLDGGQMLFATIGKLRGRALPLAFVATTQSIFVVLLLLMMAYVTVFGDLRRIIRDNRAEAQAKEAAKPADPGK